MIEYSSKGQGKTVRECLFFPFPGSDSLCFSTSYSFSCTDRKIKKKEREREKQKVAIQGLDSRSLTKFTQDFKTLGPVHISLLTKLFPSTHMKLCTQGALNKNHDKTQPLDAHRGELKICLILYPVLLKETCFLQGK